MTTKPNQYPTLADVASRIDDKGKTTSIVEVLTQTNEMLEDIPFLPCNQGMSHKTTVRSGLPTATWRKLNYGVQPSKSTTTSVTDGCGMVTTFATVDKKLAELNGMRESWRLSENAAFIEAMNQTVQNALMYGDSTVDPEKIMGFSPRFNTLDKAKAETAVNVIDAGGTGSELTSVWVVGWGPTTVHGLYPENSKAGIVETDHGDEPAIDPNGGEYRVLKTEYEWDVGLCVRDWRYVVRIANIDKNKLKARPGEKDFNLVDALTDALEMLPNLTNARVAIYCNRTIRAMLRKQIRYADNVTISMDEVAGKKVVAFDGIPVRRVDALTFTEKQVTK